MKNPIIKELTESDALVALEISRIALTDEKMFDKIAEELDVDDYYLAELRDNLNKIMN